MEQSTKNTLYSGIITFAVFMSFSLIIAILFIEILPSLNQKL
jgi:hypothetical protein